MANPFDDENGSYYVLRNAEWQYSLWPEFAEIPAGWFQEYGPSPRRACLAHIEEKWTDMRPYSLITATEENRSPSTSSNAPA